jgi:hypothetical protein
VENLLHEERIAKILDAGCDQFGGERIPEVVVALGFARGDPIVGLTITLVILKVTWDSWRTVSTTDPRRTHRRGPTRNGWNPAGRWVALRSRPA